MQKAILDAMSRHSLFYIVLLVMVLMIGPAGINRILDRVFPPPAQEAVRNIKTELEGLDKRAGKLDKLIDNQESILRHLRGVSDSLDQGAIERSDIRNRLEALEAWRQFIEKDMRKNSLPFSRQPRN